MVSPNREAKASDLWFDQLDALDLAALVEATWKHREAVRNKIRKWKIRVKTTCTLFYGVLLLYCCTVQ